MPKHGDQWPGARRGHAATIITMLPLVLVVIGGVGAHDGWIMDVEKRSWRKVCLKGHGHV